MGIKVDFSSTNDKTGFDPLEPGYYTGRIKEISQEVGKNSGKPYLKFTLALDPDADRSVQKGRMAWTNFSLQPNALWRLKKLLVDLGEDKSALEGEFEFDPNTLLGTEVVIQLDSPDAGYSNNKVTNVFGSDYEIPAEGTSSF